MPRTLLFLAALLPLLGGWSCDSLGPERDDLERARARWEATRPANYQYAVERLCFCYPVGAARVTVEWDEVTSVVFLEEAPEGFEPSADLYPSVDGLFDILEDAVESGAHSISVTYDPETGVPVEFFIDYSENIADEELGMRVTEPVTEWPVP
jgi:hypothetical protein